MRKLNLIKNIDKYREITEKEGWELLSKQRTVYIKTKRGIYPFSQNIDYKRIKIFFR